MRLAAAAAAAERGGEGVVEASLAGESEQLLQQVLAVRGKGGGEDEVVQVTVL